jgi:hypothetical protein
MANGLFAKFKQALLNMEHDLNTHGVRAVLVDTNDDDPVLATDDFLDDIASGARVAVSGDLASPTIVDGVFDAADFSWTSATGDPSEEITLYNHGMGGSDAARGLIATYDTGVTGLPVTPNGGNINVTVNVSGFFAL